jgi:glycosyltransferase involved in cell wall biosynthesis
MIIAVNTQTLLKDRLEGLGSFTDEILSRMVRNHPEHKFVFIFDREWDESFIYADNVLPVKTFLPSRHPLLWYWRFEHSIPSIISKYRADVLLSTDGYMPLHPKVRTYNVIHDIGFAHNTKSQPFLTNKYYNHYFPLFADRATRLGTVSEYSKADIVKTWGIAPDKIDVIYNGVKTVFKPMAEDEQQQVRDRISDGCPYFLFVGSLNQRKNVEGLLRAFDQFKEKVDSNHKLVIVGECMWSMSSIDRVLEHMRHADEVIFLGRVNGADLQNVVASALALVLVSFLEGFGVPLVEAMNCDVPVITSNCTSMPEVAGDAGLLVNPQSDDDITNALVRMASDAGLRAQLVTNARTQRQKFSWDKSAIDLWNGIERMMQ